MLAACVLYPGIEQYLPQCLISIDKQSFKKFDLLILEDGLSIVSFHNYISHPFTVMKTYDSSIIRNRELILQYAIENKYEKLVFFDSDDLSDNNRLLNLDYYLDYYNLVVHDMDIIDEYNQVIKETFISSCLETGRFNWLQLLDKNFAGLGNSGYNIKKLTNYKAVDKNVIAFDWWLALSVLGYQNGYYINQTLSSYRRYNNNSTVLGVNSLSDLTRELNVKIILYTELIKKANYALTDKIKIIEKLKETLLNYEKNIEFEITTNLWWNALNE